MFMSLRNRLQVKASTSNFWAVQILPTPQLTVTLVNGNRSLRGMLGRPMEEVFQGSFLKGTWPPPRLMGYGQDEQAWA